MQPREEERDRRLPGPYSNPVPCPLKLFGHQLHDWAIFMKLVGDTLV